MTKISLRNVLFNILAIITVIAVAFVLFNVFSGAKGYAVTSGSMAGTLNRGDVVFSRKADFDDIRPGDVVTFRSADSTGYFTHRVVSIDAQEKKITTKGDANPTEDPLPSDADQVVGKMWYSVPFLGYISILFAGMTTAKALVIFASAAILLIAVNLIVDKVKKKTDKSRGDSNE